MLSFDFHNTKNYKFQNLTQILFKTLDITQIMCHNALIKIKELKMKTLNVLELQKKLEQVGSQWANSCEDIVNKKNDLTRLIIRDEDLDIDEIGEFNTSAMSIAFRIVKKSGRVNKDTGSRTGKIAMSLWVEFNFRRFADGGVFTEVEISF